MVVRSADGLLQTPTANSISNFMLCYYVRLAKTRFLIPERRPELIVALNWIKISVAMRTCFITTLSGLL